TEGPARRGCVRRTTRPAWPAHRRREGVRRRAGRLSGDGDRAAQSPYMISFVGAGPGAPDLITLRGRDRLAAADVVVWASSLVPAALLHHARADAVVHDSAVMTLEDVLAVYDGAGPRARIVRLHSGDPS